MPEFLNQIKNQLNDYFQKLEKKQKIILFSATAFAALALVGVIYYFTRPEYIELYSNLEPQQTGEIINTLESNKLK